MDRHPKRTTGYCSSCSHSSGAVHLFNEGRAEGLSPEQVALLHHVTAIVLLPFAVKRRKYVTQADGNSNGSGHLRKFLPAFYFRQHKHVNSSLAGILNSLSPVWVLIIGLFFGTQFKLIRFIGVVSALSGAILYCYFSRGTEQQPMTCCR
jgi:drug/metabolite transporter (DMT)-like permease